MALQLQRTCLFPVESWMLSSFQTLKNNNGPNYGVEGEHLIKKTVHFSDWFGVITVFHKVKHFSVGLVPSL